MLSPLELSHSLARLDVKVTKDLQEYDLWLFFPMAVPCRTLLSGGLWSARQRRANANRVKKTRLDEYIRPSPVFGSERANYKVLGVGKNLLYNSALRPSLQNHSS